MFKTSYLREVRKEKYERSDVFEEDSGPETSYTSTGPTSTHGWESLQELNSRFARYINRARVLEQRNAIFRKQLETLQRMEEAAGLEEAFGEQINLNRQRIRELYSDRSKLERELKDAERMLDEFTHRYRNECDYQDQLRGTLEQLNKEADNALLRNLEYQIQSQFLQDDINSTKDRHKKNLAEIQTYVNILQQINQTTPLLPNVSVGITEEQEKLLAQRRVPALQSQLEEYKSVLCQLQSQKQRLQTETTALEQAIKSTQESYDDEIQLYNEQIETLRKDIEEAERSLEKYTSNSRRLAMYQSSLENELERYKRIIENEDNRLNSAIIGTPITLFTTNFRYVHNASTPRGGKDITQAIQDITSVKSRQKNLAKKVNKKREITPRDVMDSGPEEKTAGGDHQEGDRQGADMDEGEVRREDMPLHTGVPREDVPDGAQISKAFDTLCNMVRDRMRKHKKPEPIADFYTKGRYVLVTGDSSYPDPYFYTSSPSGGHVFVVINNDTVSPSYDPFAAPPTPSMISSPSPSPAPGPTPAPLFPSSSTEDEDRQGQRGRNDRGGDRGRGNNGGSSGRGSFQPKNGDHLRPKDHGPTSPNINQRPSPSPGSPRNHHGGQPGPRGGKNNDDSNPRRGQPHVPFSRTDIPPDSMSYEKVEVVESVEKLSPDKKVKGYEETATVVETMIEKTSKKKHGDRT